MMMLSAYGRLGQDPKAIDTSTGKSMAVASLACELPTRTEESETTWLGIVAFGRQADVLLRHGKGELLSVSGRCQMNIYQANDETRKELQVIAHSIVSSRSVRPQGGRKKTLDAKHAEPPAGDFDDQIDF